MQIENILQRCMTAGADMADVFITTQKTLSLSIRNGELESITRAAPGGIAIRFFKNGKMAFAHFSNINEEILNASIPKFAALAQKMETEEFADLARMQQYPTYLDIYNDVWIKKSVEDKIDYLKTLEKLALRHDPIIKKSNGVSYEETSTTLMLANSHGVNTSYNSTRYKIGVSIVAEKNGEMYPGEGALFSTDFSTFPEPKGIAGIFASRAVRLIGGSPVDGGDYEIIFRPRGVISILWGLVHALNGEDAFKGSSFLAGMLGQKIAIDGLTVIDDATMPKGLVSRPVDDEGSASMNSTLIENGVLSGFLYDIKTASKANAKSTASSIREDYSSYPGIGTSNFYISPGKDKLDDVIASCQKGIIVEETAGWGLHGVTGQYSAGINGILVENGKKIRPVAGVTIAAGSGELLNGIGAICDDISFYDNIASPSIMVKRMTVG